MLEWRRGREDKGGRCGMEEKMKERKVTSRAVVREGTYGRFSGKEQREGCTVC